MSSACLVIHQTGTQAVIDCRSLRELGFESACSGIGARSRCSDPPTHPDHADRTRRADAADVRAARVASAGRCRSRLRQLRLNVRRTVRRLESAGAAGSPSRNVAAAAYGAEEPQLISVEESVGKMKARWMRGPTRRW